jgi:ABC-type transport system substrate-binding protein
MLKGRITARTLEWDADIRILRGLFAAPRVLQFTMRNEGKPWEDVRVRQAISKALDRQTIINATVHPTRALRRVPLVGALAW